MIIGPRRGPLDEIAPAEQQVNFFSTVNVMAFIRIFDSFENFNAVSKFGA